jgi:hypothetical protein
VDTVAALAALFVKERVGEGLVRGEGRGWAMGGCGFRRSCTLLLFVGKGQMYQMSSSSRI